MRILFMGTGEFGLPTLKALLASRHQVIGVVTQPDRPRGRGRKLSMSCAKKVALDAGVRVYQPEKVRSEDFVEEVRGMSPDAFVVAAFGQIIPEALLDIPKYGSLNVHASLLPKYRGAAPIHYALFNGETKTGVTTMLMDPGLDTGPILLQEEVVIEPGDDLGTLEDRLAHVGAELLLRTLDGLELGTIQPKLQDDTLATQARSVKKEDCLIRWDAPSSQIVNRVRGCTPRPGAHTFLDKTSLRVWSCSVAAEKGTFGAPGEVVSADPKGITVAAGEGAVLLREVQPEGRKRMEAADFARGRRVSPGSRFSTGSA